MKSILVFLLLFATGVLLSQDVTLYNPAADAKADLEAAISTAKSQDKHVLVQVGGNWCPWCIRLHEFFHSDFKTDSILNADYVYVLVNYSKENKNPEVLASLGYPQRFGFPVLLVLGGNGQRIHTQDTGYLEHNKGYDQDKITRFLLGWNVTAVNPNSNE